MDDVQNLLFLGGSLQEGTTRSSSLKLVDFGLSADLNRNGGRMTQCCGTERWQHVFEAPGFLRCGCRYSAPEVLCMQMGDNDPEGESGRSYGKECDLWSCGVVLYVLLAGEHTPRPSTEHDH